MKKLFLIDFVRRFWIIIVLWVACCVAVNFNITFMMLGTALYAPYLFLSGGLSMLLFRNVYNTDTTDPYSDSGKLKEDFNGLSPLAKVLITKGEMLVYLCCATAIVVSLTRP